MILVTLTYFSRSVRDLNPLTMAKPFCRRLQTRQNKGARRQSLVSLISVYTSSSIIRNNVMYLGAPLVFGIQTMLDIV